MNVKILVTGCGGDIGTNIGRILKKFNLECYGVDISTLHGGKYIFTDCFQICKVSNNNYLQEIKELVFRLRIDLVIPTSEVEINFFQKNDIDFVKVLICNNKIYDISNDKYLTYLFLKSINVPYPDTHELDTTEKMNYPFILKKKNGCGNSGVYFIDNELIYKYHLNKIKNKNEYIIQEYLDGDEYTCCIFKTKNKYKHISFKRKLHGGTTKSGEVVNNDNIDNLLFKISNSIEIDGSINIQLRLVNGIPYIFEINPRFSSTIYFRYLFNFNDLIWSINNSLNIDIKTESFNINKIENYTFCTHNEHFLIKN